MPPTRAWAPGPRRVSAPLPAQRVEHGARHRHALGYLDEAALARLEELEAELRRP